MTPAPACLRRQFLQDLEADVARAVSVVQKLTSDKAEMAEMVPKGTEAMPRSGEKLATCFFADSSQSPGQITVYSPHTECN